MAKQLTSFVCQECGYDSPAYLGKCPECGAWNSMKEFRQVIGNRQQAIGQRGDSGKMGMTVQNTKPEPLRQVSMSPKERMLTGFAEMDSVLGGGIVPGSATLLAGDPGIGKSTLLLQLCLNLAGSVIPAQAGIQGNGSLIESGMTKRESQPHPDPLLSGEGGKEDRRTVLYISGEESKDQVAMRAMRLLGNRQQAVGTSNSSSSEQSESKSENSVIQGSKATPESGSWTSLSTLSSRPKGQDDNIMPENLLLLSSTNVDQIVQLIEETKPDFVVVDSIQTVESENAGGFSGSVSQVRYATTQFIRVAKSLNIPIVLVGHVNKEGMVAGPMVLSHMVDTVLFLEGEKFTKTRILRSLKNRFGPVDEVGVFMMEGEGMQEVKNPEQIFLSSDQQHVPGSVLVVIMEGSRPFLIEIQALVVYSKFTMPKRVASGVDSRRVELLLAVLQKHAKLPLETYDVFVNIAGGIKVQDPAVDLGICLAVYSSLKNKSLDKTVGIAEVGLLGELRKVGQLEKRIKEAKKLGFDQVITANTFRTIPEVLGSFGYTGRETKQLKEVDARHLKFESEED